MNCPKCDSSNIHYVQRVYEYHTIEYIQDGEVNLMNLDDVAVDETYSPYVQCEGCEATFDLDMNEIEQDLDHGVPTRIAVRTI